MDNRSILIFLTVMWSQTFPYLLPSEYVIITLLFDHTKALNQTVDYIL